jgi:Holliday junction resolvasome RuvABC endonuclease subunit
MARKKKVSDAQIAAQERFRQLDIEAYKGDTQGGFTSQIMGFDTGIARMGWCSLRAIFAIKGTECRQQTIEYLESGVIQHEKEIQECDGKRLYLLSKDIASLFYTIEPNHVAAEKIFNSGKGQGSLGLAEQALGVLKMVTYASSGEEVDLIHASTIKKVVAGSGRATKSQVRDAAWATCGIVPSQKVCLDDESDAIACAITCAKKFMEERIQFLLDVENWRQNA